jgi:hypothetical protein
MVIDRRGQGRSYRIGASNRRMRQLRQKFQSYRWRISLRPFGRYIQPLKRNASKKYFIAKMAGTETGGNEATTAKKRKTKPIPEGLLKYDVLGASKLRWRATFRSATLKSRESFEVVFLVPRNGLSLRHPTRVYEDLRRKYYFFLV